jgi:hypothetical protein
MTASTTGKPGGAQCEPSGERRALAPDVSHFLVQLSIALHKTVTYPAAHPALEAAIQSLTLRLNTVLAERAFVGIGVARDKLVIDGGTTDPTNAVLRGLAEALHRHQIGALRIDRGVSSAEVSSLLTALAADTRLARPLGAQDPATAPRWQHIDLLPVALDELELAAGEKRVSHIEQLWLSLAAATLQRAPDEELSAAIASTDLARAMRSKVQDATYDRVIADYMVRVGQELVDKGGTATQVAKQFGELVSALGEDALRMLLELGSDLTSRRQMVLDLNRSLPARSVVTLTQAAADASKEAISHALLRLFSKLAANAESDAGPVSVAADVALRDAIGQLVEGWTLADPNPTRYRELLRHLSMSGRTGEARPDPEAYADALRIVDVSLETGAVGPSVWRAVDELVEFGRLEELLGALKTAPSSDATEHILRYLVEPSRIKSLLSTPQSRNAIDQMLERTGLESADALLDVLESADSRAVRRQIIARLSSMGPELAPLVVQRMERGPWFVQRNMLFLLGELDRVPPGFSPQPWLEHADARVRREAIKVTLRVPGWRQEAIIAGLADGDTRLLSLVLSNALEQCPPGIASSLMRLLDTATLDPGLRTLAIRVLAATQTIEARDWLVNHVLGRRRWWRRPVLAAKSPEMLAALDALRSQWAAHPHVARALRLAAHSGDAEIRHVAALQEARL